jgi:hypothetical protein
MFEQSGGAYKFKFTYTYYFFLADYSRVPSSPPFS